MMKKDELEKLVNGNSLVMRYTGKLYKTLKDFQKEYPYITLDKLSKLTEYEKSINNLLKGVDTMDSEILDSLDINECGLKAHFEKLLNLLSNRDGCIKYPNMCLFSGLDPLVINMYNVAGVTENRTLLRAEYVRKDVYKLEVHDDGPWFNYLNNAIKEDLKTYEEYQKTAELYVAIQEKIKEIKAKEDEFNDFEVYRSLFKNK